MSVTNVERGGASSDNLRTTYQLTNASILLTTPEGQTIERTGARSTVTGEKVILEKRGTVKTASQNTPLRSATTQTPEAQKKQVITRGIPERIQTAAELRIAEEQGIGSEKFRRKVIESREETESGITYDQAGIYRVTSTGAPITADYEVTTTPTEGRQTYYNPLLETDEFNKRQVARVFSMAPGSGRIKGGSTAIINFATLRPDKKSEAFYYFYPKPRTLTEKVGFYKQTVEMAAREKVNSIPTVQRMTRNWDKINADLSRSVGQKVFKGELEEGITPMDNPYFKKTGVTKIYNQGTDYFVGAVEGGRDYLKYKPANVLAYAGTGAVYGYGSIAISSRSIAAASTMDLTGRALMSTWVASKTAETIVTPGARAKGRILGESAIEFGALGYGGTIGSNIATTQGLTPQPSAIPRIKYEVMKVPSESGTEKTIYRGAALYSGEEGTAVNLLGITNKGIAVGRLSYKNVDVSNIDYPKIAKKNIASYPQTPLETSLFTDKPTMEAMKITGSDIRKVELVKIFGAASKGLTTISPGDLPMETKGGLTPKQMKAIYSYLKSNPKAYNEIYGSLPDVAQRPTQYKRAIGDIELKFSGKPQAIKTGSELAKVIRGTGMKDAKVLEDPEKGLGIFKGQDKIIELKYPGKTQTDLIGSKGYRYGLLEDRGITDLQGFKVQKSGEQLIRKTGTSATWWKGEKGEIIIEPPTHRAKDPVDVYSEVKSAVYFNKLPGEHDVFAEEWRGLEWRNPEVKTLFEEQTGKISLTPALKTGAKIEDTASFTRSPSKSNKPYLLSEYKIISQTKPETSFKSASRSQISSFDKSYSINISKSPSVEKPSPSPSISPSFSSSPSRVLSPSKSTSTFKSVYPSITPSTYPSIYPSTYPSISPSISKSPSISPSISINRKKKETPYLFKISREKPRKTKTKPIIKPSQPGAYVPTVTSMTYNIRGKKDLWGAFTGAGIRPIPKNMFGGFKI